MASIARFRWLWACWLLGPLLLLLLPSLLDAFVLEGSPTSYAQYKKWLATLNGSLALEFQTKDPNGLLLYTDDGGARDFLELKLVDGVLRMRFNLGGGAVMISAGRNLHDGQWHKVEVVRNGKDTQLRLDDDEVQTRLSRGSDLLFGNYTANSHVYVGGVPGWYGSKLTLLTLPSVYFEPRFRGAVRNLVYASDDAQRRQDMIGFKGVRSNQLDACEVHDPCQHGGVCISTDSGALCDCQQIDYDGAFCDKEKPPPEATFRGSEYISYDLSGGEPIVSSSDHISMYFKTRQAEGLFLYTGDGDDFLMLSLRDGWVVLTVSLGSGSIEKTVRPSRVRFDDNQWHNVLVHRKVKEFSITVDGVYTERGATAGTFSHLLSSFLFVGGSDRTGRFSGTKIRSNFVGCLRKVEFSADSLTLGLLDLSRVNNKLINQHGTIQYMCQEVEAADPVTFTTKESFLALPGWQASRGGSISFKIRTIEANGVLMYNSGATAQGDFFAFELLDGHVFLLLNLGSGAVKVKATTRRVDDGQWHTISLRRTGKSGRVTVDEYAVDFSTPGNSNQLDLEGPLYLGGIGASDSVEGTSMPVELWTGLLRYGYVGCMRDLVVNSKVVDVASHAQKQDSGSIRPSCHTSPPQCDSQPCLNGGHCLEGWNRFTCDCTHTSFTGGVCAKDATTLSFDGEQYMKIFTAEGSHTQAEDIKLRFRTTRPNGLLLATTSDKTSNYFLAVLESSRVKVTFNFGEGAKVAYIGQGLNDDQWHSLHLFRRGRVLDLKVDSDSTTADLGKQHMSLDISVIHVGAITASDKGNSVTSGVKDLPNFVGHMQHFFFNGNHFFEMARSGLMTNFQVTAKFGKKDQIVHHPVTFKSKYTFIGMPQLKAYSSMNLYFQFKTLEPNGLVLYNAGKGQDFISMELVNGHLHYHFNLGDGPRKVRSNTRSTLNDNKWHAVTVGRPTLRQHTLMVDDMIATVTSNGPNVHLDLDGLLYLGGVRRSMYSSLPKLIQSKHGFEGCLASLDLNGEMLDPSKDAVIPSTLVAKGCAGPVTKCSNNACSNRGVCVQMWNSYTCDCDMTSFTGPTCSDESIAYEFGNGNGLITFKYQLDKRPDTKSDLMALGFITHSDNAVLVRVDSGSSNDYMELEIVDGNIFIVYNLGTEDHPLGELSVRVNDGLYHVVRFTRSGPNSTIQIDDHNVATKHPKGKQLTIFNSHSQIQVGGKKNVIRGKVERPFQGVIAGLVYNGHRILDMAAEDDPRISSEGDVELLMSIPFDMQQNRLSPNPQMQQQPRAPTIFDGDDLVFSGAGSGCWDDEDRCGVVEHGSGDDLITPVYIPPTPKPRPTAPPTIRPTPPATVPKKPAMPYVVKEDRICDDEEDCTDGSGSGEHVVVSSPTEILKPEVVFTVVTESQEPEVRLFPQPELPRGNKDRQKPKQPVVTRRPYVPPTPPSYPGSRTSVRPPEIHVVPQPYPELPLNTVKDRQKPNPKPKSTADDTALAIGIVAGILIAIVLIALVVYIVRNRTVGSYKVDESKNYQFSAVTNQSSSPPLLNGQQQPQMNGSVKPPAPEKATKLPKKKDLKEWYV